MSLSSWFLLFWCEWVLKDYYLVMIIGLMCHLDSNKEGDGVDIPEVAHPKQDSHDATADHPSGQEVPKMDPLSHLSTTDTQRKPINVRNLLSHYN